MSRECVRRRRGKIGPLLLGGGGMSGLFDFGSGRHLASRNRVGWAAAAALQPASQPAGQHNDGKKLTRSCWTYRRIAWHDRESVAWDMRGPRFINRFTNQWQLCLVSLSSIGKSPLLYYAGMSSRRRKERPLPLDTLSPSFWTSSYLGGRYFIFFPEKRERESRKVVRTELLLSDRDRVFWKREREKEREEKTFSHVLLAPLPAASRSKDGHRRE